MCLLNVNIGFCKDKFVAFNQVMSKFHELFFIDAITCIILPLLKLKHN
jgi:hypothetical protein